MDMFEPTEVDARRAQDANASSSDAVSGLSGSEEASGSDSDGPSAPGGRRAAGVVDHIFARKQPLPASKKTSKSPMHSAPTEEDAAAVAKEERRRFMSPRAAVVAGAAPSPAQGRPKPTAGKADDGGVLSREEFKKLQREVQLYGACVLATGLHFHWGAAHIFWGSRRRERPPPGAPLPPPRGSEFFLCAPTVRRARTATDGLIVRLGSTPPAEQPPMPPTPHFLFQKE